VDVSRVASSVLRAVADGTTRGDAFVVGQHLSGRVLQAMADGMLLIALGDRRVLAENRGAVPLAVGQEIAVEVLQAGEAIELRLEPAVLPSTVAGEQNYRLAAALNALAGGRGVSGASDSSAGFVALLRALGGGAESTPALDGAAAAVARAMDAVSADAPARALATELRAWIREGGLLFESHLRAALERGRTPEEALAELCNDLKVLLGELARASADSSGPVSEQLKEMQDGVANGLLQRQAEFAYRWLTSGTAVFDVPVRSPEAERHVEIRVNREREGGGAGKPGRFRVVVFVPSDLLGSIEATLTWLPGRLDASFAVERASTADELRGALSPLSERLGLVFAAVSLDVAVEAERFVRRRSDDAPPPLPGGSVVSVRA
jgi:hypothetical protein